MGVRQVWAQSRENDRAQTVLVNELRQVGTIMWPQLAGLTPCAQQHTAYAL